LNEQPKTNGHHNGTETNGHSVNEDVERRLEELEKENQILKAEKSKIRELLKVAQEAENWKMLSENLNENLNVKINGENQ
jgi:hypothetical protein